MSAKIGIKKRIHDYVKKTTALCLAAVIMLGSGYLPVRAHKEENDEHIEITYEVIKKIEGEGDILLSKTEFLEGEEVSFALESKKNYKNSTISCSIIQENSMKLKGSQKREIVLLKQDKKEDLYSFTMPAANVCIHAVFVPEKNIFSDEQTNHEQTGSEKKEKTTATQKTDVQSPLLEADKTINTEEDTEEKKEENRTEDIVEQSEEKKTENAPEQSKEDGAEVPTGERKENVTEDRITEKRETLPDIVLDERPEELTDSSETTEKVLGQKTARGAKGDIGVKQILDYPLNGSGSSYLNYVSPITGDKMRVSLHRTSDDQVAYCLNRTKMSDKDDYNWDYEAVANKDTKYTDLQRNILLSGYPGNSIGALKNMYGISVNARSAEQATQLAIWIGNYMIGETVSLKQAWTAHAPYNTSDYKAAELAKAILTRADHMLEQKLTVSGKLEKEEGEEVTYSFSLTAKAQYYPVTGTLSNLPAGTKISCDSSIICTDQKNLTMNLIDGTAKIYLTFSKYAESAELTLKAKGTIPIPPSYGGILYYENSDTDYQAVVRVKEVKPFYSEQKAAASWTTVPVGWLHLKKTSEDGQKAGFLFHLTGPNQYSKDFTTDGEGKIDFGRLEPGIYTITEKNEDKYVTAQVQTVELKDGDDKTVTFHNVLRKMVINLEKRDSEGGIARGDGSLVGAQYTIYDQTGREVETLTTGIDHKAKSGLLPVGVYTVKETVPSQGYNLDPAVYTVDGTKGDTGLEVCSYEVISKEEVIKGKIKIIKYLENPDSQSSEIIPAKGVQFSYRLNTNPSQKMTITLDEKGIGESEFMPYGIYTLEEENVPKGWKKMLPQTVRIEKEGEVLTYYLLNKVDGADCKIIKKDKDTGKQIAYAGTRFLIRKKDTGEVVSQSITYPVKTKIQEFVTNKEGYLMLPEQLQAGDYLLYELEAPEGYVKEEKPVEFTVPDEASKTIEIIMENAPQRIELEIGKQGALFHDAAEKNIVELEQNKELAEKEEKEDETEQEKNEEVKIQKLVQPVFEEKPLEGVIYELKAMEEICTLDGTCRIPKGTTFKAATDQEGKASFTNLYPGRYELVEKKTLAGFLKDEEPKEVLLTYGDPLVSVKKESLSFNNRQQVPKLDFVKKMETNPYLKSEKPWEEVLFGLYAGKDLKEQLANGEEGAALIKKHTLLDIYRIGENGEGISLYQTHLPYGDYYIEEIKTHPAYVRDTKHYKFEFYFDEKEKEEREIKVTKEPIENRPAEGRLEFTKQEISTGKVIPGCKVEIKDESGKVMVQGTTNSKGEICFERLPIGKYTYREYEAPKGYLIDEKEYPFEIVQDGQIVKAVMENDYIKLSISKQDITTGKELLGAHLILKNEKGEELEDWISKEKPYLVEYLEPGWYELMEITAPDGYEKAETIRFEVKAQGEIQTVVMVDEPKKKDEPDEEATKASTTENTATEDKTVKTTKDSTTEEEKIKKEEKKKEVSKSKKESKGTGKTGDITPIELCIGCMILSLGIGAGILFWKKKKNTSALH